MAGHSVFRFPLLVEMPVAALGPHAKWFLACPSVFLHRCHVINSPAMKEVFVKWLITGQNAFLSHPHVIGQTARKVPFVRLLMDFQLASQFHQRCVLLCIVKQELCVNSLVEAHSACPAHLPVASFSVLLGLSVTWPVDGPNAFLYQPPVKTPIVKVGLFVKL